MVRFGIESVDTDRRRTREPQRTGGCFIANGNFPDRCIDSFRFEDGLQSPERRLMVWASRDIEELD
jgi:hypothetical protein